MTFLLYLCKVCLCSGVLLGYYWLFLRNRRFHRYNRYFLLAAFILPVLLPMLRIGIWNEPESVVNQAVYRTVNVLTVNYGESDGAYPGPENTRDLFKIEYLLYIVYAAGSLALLVLLYRSLAVIRRIARRYPHERIEGMTLYNTTEPGTPFSFFNAVFWNERLSFNSKEGQQIFRHELFHVRQRHSFDIMVAELITAFCWINPFFHIAKKELKAIHEFLADEYAASGNDRYGYAELLVLQTIQNRDLPITHRFFHNHIKRRISMITHLNAAKNSYWSRLMALPLLVLLFCSIALYAQQPNAVPATQAGKDGEMSVLNLVVDAGHGGADNGATSFDGRYTEKELTLAISQQIQRLAPSYNINVTLTRAKDELPGSTTAIDEALRTRTTIAKEAKADAFVSIHIGAASAEAAPKYGGFEVYIPYGNTSFDAPSRQLGSAIVQSITPFYSTKSNLLQRKEKGIWVLNQAPCAAVLIECGYITNNKDLAFLTKTSNQEAIAKKILEGIAAFRKQKGNKEQPTAGTLAPLEDSMVVMNLSKHFCRNTIYPQTALENNLEGSLYFSVDTDAKGQVKHFMSYGNPPRDAININEVVVVGYPHAEQSKATQLSTEDQFEVFRYQVHQTFQKKINTTGITTPRPARYYFKAIFKMDKPIPVS